MIIKSYWSNEKEGKQQESFIKNYLKNKKIKRFFISDKEINNFKIVFDDAGRFNILYSLKGNNLKYYVGLLNSSFLFYGDYIKVLLDKDWLNYKNGILKEVIKWKNKN